MNSFPVGEKTQNWLESQPHLVPLRAVTLGSSTPEGLRLNGLIADSGLPSDSLGAAMLWLRVGIIEPAHDIVQASATPVGSYLHGVVHRLEGDYWNSKYWFRQVNDKQLLQSLSSGIVGRLESEELMAVATSLKVIQGTTFSPADFVSAHENWSKSTKPDPSQVAAIERIAWIEWQALWQLL